MLEVFVKITKLLLFCLYGLALALSGLIVHNLWAERVKVRNTFWRWVYTALMLPFVGIAFTAEIFDKWFEKSVAKF